ncbi:MAG: hypothetical protein ABI353_08980 [Isosphaeraceae bacterium]
MMKPWHQWVFVLIGLATLANPAWAAGKPFDELMKRIPDQANILLLINTDQLLDSPLGRRENWRETVGDRPTGVFGLSNDMARLAMAAGVDLDSLNVHWKIGMAESRGSVPKLSTLASREGGYVEQLETQNVAWTPRNFYLFSFPNRIIGFAAPADRQAMAGWIVKTLAKPRTFPPGWADLAVYRANGGTPIVLAVNLARAISPKHAEVWLRSADRAKNAKGSADLVAQRLATAKSALIQVDVKETIQGTLRVEFEEPVSTYASQIKPIVLDLLADYGAELSEIKTWTTEAKGNILTMTGRLSKADVARVLSVVTAPRLSAHGSYGATPNEDDNAEASAKAEPPAEPPPATPADTVLKASKGYFLAVVDITQSLRTQKASSRRTQNLWYDRAAKQIEELPILNIDSDLLDWGSTVARTFREMSLGIHTNVKDQAHRIAGTAGGYYGGYGVGYGVGSVGPGRAAEAEVIKKQSNAVMDVELDKVWQTIQISIADTRRKMTEKYKVEF